MRGRTEGREQMKNGEGAEEGLEASPGHERAVQCGAVLFPCPTTASVQLLN